jgi:hypothetical protein
MKSTDVLLKQLYYDPAVGLLSKAKFVAKLRRLHPEIRTAHVAAFVDRQQLQQMNAPRPFKGFFKIVSLPRTFQIDFFFMNDHKHANRNVGAFLVCVDVLSRKMFVYPCKNRTTATILSKVAQLQQDAGMLEGLKGDDEFEVARLREWCEGRGIILSTDVSKHDHADVGDKLGIVDAAVRTIKTRIRNYMLAHNTTKYITVLPALVASYNQTPHLGIGQRTPDDVYGNLAWQYKQYDDMMDYNKRLHALIDLSVGDTVRRRVDRGRFAKETAKFSDQLFTIHELSRFKYRIRDAQGKLQPRKYKNFELLKIKHPALVETAFTVPAGSTGLQKIGNDKEQARRKRALARAGVHAGNIISPSAKRVTRVPARLFD